MRVSPSQEKAITHGEGPALVLAGPGSGKTAVITRRAEYLIRRAGADPRQILVITFARSAAAEMRTRFAALAGETHLPVSFGTFHAVFFQILKAAYHYRAGDIVQEDEKLRIIGQILRGLSVRGEDERELTAGAAAQISLVKNEQILPEHFYSSVMPDEAFRTLYREYGRILQETRRLDFDDILVQCAQLLAQRPDILAAWQKRFGWILVDEFQDINALQYGIVRMLAAPGNNLFAVGDDDQSIYRFRGAKPEIMQRFVKDYPDAAVIALEENYRSAPDIVQAASMVIACNRRRFPKKVRCAGPAEGKVDLREFATQDREYEWICGALKESLASGRKPGEIALLFRTNAGGRTAVRHLTRLRIPFRMRDEIPDLFDHWIARDILAYLRLAAAGDGAMRRADLLRVMNRPLRYLSRDAMPHEKVSSEDLLDFYEDRPWMQERVRALLADLGAIRSMRPYAAVNYVHLGMGYDRFLTEYARTHGVPLQELTDIVLEVQEDAAGVQDLTLWEEQIRERREKQKEAAAARRRSGEKETEDAVVLSTLHGAKGLEFDEVFLPDLNDGIVPHRKAQIEADLEEERRLFYVGMTRAKRYLHLCWPRERFGRTAKPSPFLTALTGEKNG